MLRAEALHPDTIFLMLERGVGPTGERRFKDIRSQGAWPSPGVYNIRELARALLTERERHAQRLLHPTKTFTPLGTLLSLWRMEQQQPLLGMRSPRALLRQWKQDLKIIEPLGLSGEDCQELIQRLESQSQQPELTQWSRRLLTWLKMRLLTKESLSEWGEVQAACEYLEGVLPSEARAICWESVCERPPGANVLCFELVDWREALPLEERFLKALARVAQVKRPSAPPEAAPLKISARAFPHALPHEIGIFWAGCGDAPGSVEWLERVPGQLPLDVELPREKAVPPLLRALYMQASRNPRFARHGSAILSAWGLPAEGFADVASLSAFLQEHDEREDLRELGTLHGADTVPLSEWIATLHELDYFSFATPDTEDDDDNPALTHPRLHAQGMGVHALEDLPWSPHAHIALWGTQDSLREWLDPASRESLRRQRYPETVRSFLRAHGYAMPELARECAQLRAALAAQGDAVFLLAEAPHKAPPPRPAPLPKLQMEKVAAFSPSALESCYQCPLRYALERRLKLQPEESWDDDHVSVSRRGKWIHGALEQYFRKPDWEQPETRLESLLRESVAETFEGSAGYLQILQSNAPSLATALGAHIRHFERPLYALFPQRTMELENDIERRGQVGALPLHGFSDRVDVLGNDVLLWDYKSGKVDGKKALDQFNDAKLQWFLYKEMLEQQTPGRRVVGGGYLNPLDRERSRLFVYEEAPPAFRDFLLQSGHHVQQISRDHAVEIRTRLHEILGELHTRLQSQDFPPEPRKERYCQYCAQAALCGRPFLRLTEAL